MLESLNYSFRNPPKNIIWVIYRIKHLRNYKKKNHGVLRGPQLGKQRWRARLGILRVKWTRSFRRKTNSGFCACAITFQTQYNTCYWQAATDARLKQDNAEFHYRCSGVVTQTSVRPLNAVGSSVTPSTFRLQTPISADRECSSLQFTFRYCGVDQQMNVDGVPHASGIPN